MELYVAAKLRGRYGPGLDPMAVREPCAMSPEKWAKMLYNVPDDLMVFRRNVQGEVASDTFFGWLENYEIYLDDSPAIRGPPRFAALVDAAIFRYFTPERLDVNRRNRVVYGAERTQVDALGLLGKPDTSGPFGMYVGLLPDGHTLATIPLPTGKFEKELDRVEKDTKRVNGALGDIVANYEAFRDVALFNPTNETNLISDIVKQAKPSPAKTELTEHMHAVSANYVRPRFTTLAAVQLAAPEVRRIQKRTLDLGNLALDPTKLAEIEANDKAKKQKHEIETGLAEIQDETNQLARFLFSEGRIKKRELDLIGDRWTEAMKLSAFDQVGALKAYHKLDDDLHSLYDDFYRDGAQDYAEKYALFQRAQKAVADHSGLTVGRLSRDDTVKYIEKCDEGWREVLRLHRELFSEFHPSTWQQDVNELGTLFNHMLKESEGAMGVVNSTSKVNSRIPLKTASQLIKDKEEKAKAQAAAAAEAREKENKANKEKRKDKAPTGSLVVEGTQVPFTKTLVFEGPRKKPADLPGPKAGVKEAKKAEELLKEGKEPRTVPSAADTAAAVKAEIADADRIRKTAEAERARLAIAAETTPDAADAAYSEAMRKAEEDRAIGVAAAKAIFANPKVRAWKAGAVPTRRDPEEEAAQRREEVEADMKAGAEIDRQIM